MRFGDLVFRFRWVPTLLLALPIPLFLALGVWQLERAGEKAMLAQTQAARARQEPVRVDALVADAEALRHAPIEASGRFVSERQVLIEGRRLGGLAGFHVITPLRLEGSGIWLLVNRGWIPAQSGGEPAPAPVPEGLVHVAGEADIPSAPALVLHGGREAARGWGRRWPYLTVDLFAATVGDPVQPVVMLLAPGEANGFSRHWVHPAPNPWMHQGYAVQWFGFALIALVLYLRLSLERTGGRGEPA